jgi:predicted  nucleic acid-binding Zn-ribbon protein
MKTLTSGTTVGAGSFRCSRCGYVLALSGSETLGDCPACKGHDFQRASLFGRAVRTRWQDRTQIGGRRSVTDAGSDTIKTGLVGGPPPHPDAYDSDAWLQQARALLEEPGEYLAYEEGGDVKTASLTREWTRIGRSLAADVRFDDPTVSRRHALIVRQADGVRVLDDRSLNGVFVNGERIDRSGVAQQALRDGDEILIGRYRLRFITVAPAPAGSAAGSARHGAD